MCPHCLCDNSKVVKTHRHDNRVWRVRKCYEPSCLKTFVSQESSSATLRLPEAIRAEQVQRLDRRHEAAKHRTMNFDAMKAWG